MILKIIKKKNNIYIYYDGDTHTDRFAELYIYIYKYVYI